MVGAAPQNAYSDDPRTLSWSDGTPTGTGSNRQGVYTWGGGNGFQVTAPADLTVRTLTVYVGGAGSSAQLTATLSDGSAPAYVSPVLSGPGQYDGTYQVTYNAASAGQTLTVQWKQGSAGGNITLQAAALAGSPAVPPPGVPTNVAASDGTSTTSVSVTWTAVTGATSYTVYRSTSAGTQGSALGSPTAPSFVDSTVTPGTTYYYGVTATNSGGTSALSAQNSGFAAVAPPGVPTNVAASDGTSTTSVSVTWTAVTGATSYTVYRSTSAGTQGSALGSPTAPSFVDSTVTPGTTYYYGVTATNGGGTSALSAQNSGFAAVSGGGGGSLTGAALTPTSPVNLTTVGTSDWAHWPGHDHKATGGGQLPPYTLVGAAPQNAYSDDPRTLSWSDGTPTGTGSNRQGVYTWGGGNGFQVTAPGRPHRAHADDLCRRRRVQRAADRHALGRLRPGLCQSGAQRPGSVRRRLPDHLSRGQRRPDPHRPVDAVVERGERDASGHRAAVGTRCSRETATTGGGWKKKKARHHVLASGL